MKFEIFSNQKTTNTLEKSDVEKKGIMKKIEKAIRIFVATGIITGAMSPVLDSRIVKGYTTDKYIEYCGIENELEQEKMRKKLSELEKQFSCVIYPYLEESDRGAKENLEDISVSPEIKGFEKLGLDNEMLAKIWNEENYPKGTINGELKEIFYIDKDSENVEDYNIAGQRIGGIQDLKDRIEFFGGLKNYDKKDLISSLDWFFAHELGHINDWENCNKLKPEERAEFLLDVLKNFEAPNSFRDPTGYINSINNPNIKAEKYYKVREYWAILCEYYLTFPQEVERILSLEERELVKKWLLRNDSDFNAIESVKNRKNI